ncbi:MAG: hypothetical protein GX825_02200 [Syntrophomonadaceae bacterium]|nr:hypothetical protein [Syntrophomonadaceae bacterium]
MTELFVNNEQVTLPDKFSTEVIEGNPFINPIGETSLDITCSLLEPANAYIFGYLHRTNSKKDISQSLDCKLLVDATEYYGKCIILEFSDEEVKFQLVFKNSIFTYAISEDLELRHLNLGTAVINPGEIISNFDKTYPEVDFQLLMVYNPDITYSFAGFQLVDGDLLNRLTYVWNGTTHLLTYGLDGENVNLNGMFANGDLRIKKVLYSPQPYLSAIVKKIINALGFQLGVNEITEHPVYKYAIIVNGATSLHYSDMLPDWTVKKFIEQVQIWQNCRFIYNSITGVVDIRYNHRNSQNPTYTELEVLDDFSGASEEEDPVMNRQRNIEYNLPDTDGYKYTRIDQKVLEEFPNVWMSAGTLQAAVTALMANGNPSWIYYFDNSDPLLIMQGGMPKIVHEYPMLQNNPDTDSADETLDIVPAEMKLITFYVRDRSSNATSSWVYTMVPVNRESSILLTDIDDTQHSMPVDDAIQDPSSITGNKETSEVMQIVLYSGYRNAEVKGAFVSMEGLPEPYTRSVSDIYPDGGFHTLVSTTPQVDNLLSLDHLNRHLYEQELEIDPSKRYRFRFFRPMRDLDITDIFVINGEYYRAYQFHKTITSDGMDEVIEGEFYKLK